ncbi:MAG: hypothetical protein KIT31_03170 [Deltaproteobacteria bacterium]|nr:hypothetical protein [Deltaproteobacteria bacterium]
MARRLLCVGVMQFTRLGFTMFRLEIDHFVPVLHTRNTMRSLARPRR